MNATPDWLALPTDPPKRKRGRPPKVRAGAKLTQERTRAPTMQQRLVGKNRIWACDGEYVYFRPFRYIDGVRTEVANPATYERHNRFLAQGHYEYVETQDDVQIFKVTENSPFARKGQYLGEMSDADIRRAVAIAACKRDWTLYADALEELAGRIKGRYDSGFAKQVFGDYLTYIERLIDMRGGPSPTECGRGLQTVRTRRGEDRGRLIMLPNR